MKTYTITVNGNVYDVTVEEGTGVATPVAEAPKAVAAPKAAPKAAAPAGAQGGVKMAHFFEEQTFFISVEQLLNFHSADFDAVDKGISHFCKVGFVITFCDFVIDQRKILSPAAVDCLKGGNGALKSPAPDVSAVKESKIGFCHIF